MTDNSCEIRDISGDLLDSMEHPQSAYAEGGKFIGMEILRMVKGLDEDDTPHDMAFILALCEAARLSCRTGQGESPANILTMLKSP